nr:uncharacterized protein LOC123756998 [Procambarus clarkii]
MAATTALSTAGTPGPVATDQHHHHPTPSEQQQQQTPQQRCTETEEHHRTGVTVTLPTIQVTEPRVSASDSVPLELLSLDLQHTTLEYSSAPVRSSSSTSLASGFSTTSLPLLEVGKPRLASTEVKLPPLLVPPVVPPSSLAEAVRLVRSSNMFLYLTLKHPPSHLHYNPYSFNVESSRPRGRSQYAILSSAGVTQVWPSEVTFTTMDDFQREFAAYKHLKKAIDDRRQVVELALEIRFFRNFRLSKTWQVWRRSVRCRKVREAKTRVSAYLLTLQPPFHATLVNVAALCHRLSHMGLLQVSSAEPAVMETWLARQQAALTNVRTRLASFRTLLLQVVASMMHTDDPPADADGKFTKEEVRRAIGRGGGGRGERKREQKRVREGRESERSKERV